ncbi:hypothetical protein GF378_01445 [Candidatus Pacearchaeota archaeon]|nr:hypothetical protein [Candidatus Pacearchaeota archaeon]
MTDRPTRLMIMKHENRESGEISLEYHQKGFGVLSDKVKKFKNIYERIVRIIHDPDFLEGLEGKKGTYVCFENVNGKYRAPEEYIRYSVTQKRAREILDSAIQEEFKGVAPEKRNKQRETLATKTWEWINSID